MMRAIGISRPFIKPRVKDIDLFHTQTGKLRNSSQIDLAAGINDFEIGTVGNRFERDIIFLRIGYDLGHCHQTGYIAHGLVLQLQRPEISILAFSYALGDSTSYISFASVV